VRWRRSEGILTLRVGKDSPPHERASCRYNEISAN
jgi:hypothetical protein